MTSPADADNTPPARHDGAAAWAAKIALGVVVFILVAEFALPGFLAAGISKATPNLAAANRAAKIVLAAPVWLSRRWEAFRRYYIWQYRFAGGKKYNMMTTWMPL